MYVYTKIESKWSYPRHHKLINKNLDARNGLSLLELLVREIAETPPPPYILGY